MSDAVDPWDAVERASRAEVMGTRSDTDDQLGPDDLREGAINPNASGDKGGANSTAMMPPMVGGMGGGGQGGQPGGPMMGADPTGMGMAAGLAARGAPLPGGAAAGAGGLAGPGVGGLGVGGLAGAGIGGGVGSVPGAGGLPGGGPFAAGSGADAGIDLDGDGVPDVDRFGNPLNGPDIPGLRFDPSDPRTWPPGYSPTPTRPPSEPLTPPAYPSDPSGRSPIYTSPGFPNPGQPGYPSPDYPSPTTPTSPRPSYPDPGTTWPSDPTRPSPGLPGSPSYPGVPSAGPPGIPSGPVPSGSGPGAPGDGSYSVDTAEMQKASARWDEIKDSMATLKSRLGLHSDFGLAEPVNDAHNDLSNESATWGDGAASTFDQIMGKLTTGTKSYSDTETSATQQARNIPL